MLFVQNTQKTAVLASLPLCLTLVTMILLPIFINSCVNVSGGDDISISDPATYSLTYHSNEAHSGTVPVDTNSYPAGAEVPVAGNTGNLDRTNDTFAGWTNREGAFYAPGDTFSMPATNVTLFVKWQLVPNENLWFSKDFVFNMFRLSGNITFPSGVDDSDLQTVQKGFQISETEVSWQMWTNVHDWATNQGYTFSSSGAHGVVSGEQDSPKPYYGSGEETHPVTLVSWYDAVLWCNALTEFYNQSDSDLAPLSLDVAYTLTDGSPFTNIIDTNRGITLVDNASGFRLPKSAEWELAARYIVDEDLDNHITNSGEYYPGNFASGADTNRENDPMTDYDRDGNTNSTADVAWYSENAELETHPVKNAGIQPNALGLYNMSGNVREWCQDSPDAENCYIRGGYFKTYTNTSLMVGKKESLPPGTPNYYTGFRVARWYE